MCKTIKKHAFYAAVNKTWYSLNSLEISLMFNVHVCGIVFCLESITVASIEYGQFLAKCLYQCKRPFELWILFYIVLCNKYFPLNLQMDFDCCGLQIGSREKEVKKVYIALCLLTLKKNSKRETLYIKRSEDLAYESDYSWT